MQYCRRCIRKQGIRIDKTSLATGTCDSCKRENVEVFQAKEPGTFEEEALEPELEITAIIEETPESDETVEKLKEWSSFVETPVEAEPEPSGSIDETATELMKSGVSAVAIEKLVEIVKETPKVDNTAEIAALMAKLAELTKDEPNNPS